MSILKDILDDHKVVTQLRRIADALDRAFPIPALGDVTVEAVDDVVTGPEPEPDESAGTPLSPEEEAEMTAAEGFLRRRGLLPDVQEDEG